MVSGSTEHGVLVEHGGALVEGNVATGNGDDGLHLLSDREDGIVVTNNTANDNADLGIFALRSDLGGPIVDGGGNKASGNGNPDQCVGVSCK